MPGKDSIPNMLIMKLLGIQCGIALVMNGERLMSILCQFLRVIVTKDQEEAENTYFKERNPMKCHLTQIWRNITAASAFYNFHGGRNTF